MTVTRSSAAIRADVNENAKAINATLSDAELFARLKGAATELPKLQKRADELAAELIAAQAAEAKAKREAAFALIRNMRVQTAGSEKVPSGSPIGQQHIIRFERSAYSSTTHRNEWVAAEVNGFASLTPDQFAYLIEKAPDQIPTGIMALAPDDPRRAFDAYFLGLRRGYLAA